MDKIGNWVPQIFYDLIGRIIPGSLLLIIAFVIFQGPLAINASASILVLAFLTVAYVLGALLGGVTAVINRDFWKSKKRDLTKKKEDDVSYIYDYIQFHRPDIGSRLAKLSAERHMCRVITVGAIFLFIAYSIARPEPYPSSLFWFVEIGLVTMGVFASFLHRHLSSRSEELMSNNWRLIHEENKKPANKERT